jgi:hypothetical protein
VKEIFSLLLLVGQGVLEVLVYLHEEVAVDLVGELSHSHL